MTSKEQLNKRAIILSKLAEIEFEIDWMAGRPRFNRVDNGRFLSPRMSKGNMMKWMDAFEEGILVMQGWAKPK